MYPVIFSLTPSDFSSLVQVAGGLTNFSSLQEAPMSIATPHRQSYPTHTYPMETIIFGTKWQDGMAKI